MGEVSHRADGLLDDPDAAFSFRNVFMGTVEVDSWTTRKVFQLLTGGSHEWK